MKNWGCNQSSSCTYYIRSSRQCFEICIPRFVSSLFLHAALGGQVTYKVATMDVRNRTMYFFIRTLEAFFDGVEASIAYANCMYHVSLLTHFFFFDNVPRTYIRESV